MDFIKDIDEVYVIHCIENKERLKNIEYQIENNSWLKNKLQIHWTCYFPFSNIATNALIMSNKSRFISNKSEFNLTREFYQIIKLAYLKGLNYICIFEDDFSLVKENLFNEFIKTIPEDFDIIQLSYLFNSKMYDYKKLLHKFYVKKEYWMFKTFGAWSNNGIILSRNGMKYFIDSIDKEFKAADIPMHESKNNYIYFGKVNQSSQSIKHYIPTIPLVYVDGYNSTVQDDDKNDLYDFYRTKLDKNNYNIL